LTGFKTYHASETEYFTFYVLDRCTQPHMLVLLKTQSINQSINQSVKVVSVDNCSCWSHTEFTHGIWLGKLKCSKVCQQNDFHRN